MENGDLVVATRLRRLVDVVVAFFVGIDTLSILSDTSRRAQHGGGVEFYLVDSTPHRTEIV